MIPSLVKYSATAVLGFIGGVAATIVLDALMPKNYFIPNPDYIPPPPEMSPVFSVAPDSNNNYTVSVSINDTGDKEFRINLSAKSTYISKETAEEIGLSSPERTPCYEHVKDLREMGLPTPCIYVTLAKEMNIGGYQLKDVTVAIVFSNDQVTDTIGLEDLNKLGTLTIKDGILTLTPHPNDDDVRTTICETDIC
jgi:hypothetical protein